MSFIGITELRQALREEVDVALETGALKDLADQRQAEWTVNAQATAAEALAAKAAEAGKSHYITSLHGSFSAAQIALLTLEDGTTVIGRFYVHNQRDVTFEKPVKLTAGNAANVRLAAGAAGVVGAVTLSGFTK